MSVILIDFIPIGSRYNIFHLIDDIFQGAKQEVLP